MKEEVRTAIIFVIFLIPLMCLFFIVLGWWLIFSIPISVILSWTFVGIVLVVFRFKKSSERQKFFKQILISLLISISISSLIFGAELMRGDSGLDDVGDYHTIDGDGKQIQYQGSEEQKDDLKAIDEYAKDNPGF